MLNLLQTDPGQYFAIVLVVVVSIVLHELAHGWAAIKLGDRTPIETGHMTLNPLVHMGWLSLGLLAVVGIAWGQMPVNVSRLRGKYADFWVSVAGPASNLVLAILGVVGMALVARYGYTDEPTPVAKNGFILLQTLARTNFALMILNLIPVPPLDGSRMLASVLPAYRRMLNSETARGAVTAVLIAIFIGGGRYIFQGADYLMIKGVIMVARVLPHSGMAAG